MSTLTPICIRCIRAAGGRGAWLCPESGVSYRDHVASGDCPAGRFPVRGLGDVLAAWLKRWGVGPLAKRAFADIREANRWQLPDGAAWEPGCGCPARQERLNRAVPFGRPPIEGPSKAL